MDITMEQTPLSCMCWCNVKAQVPTVRFVV